MIFTSTFKPLIYRLAVALSTLTTPQGLTHGANGDRDGDNQITI